MLITIIIIVVCMHVCPRMCERTFLYICLQDVSFFLYCSPFYFVKQGLPLHFGLTVFARLAWKSLESTCLHLPSNEVTGEYLFTHCLHEFYGS